MIVMIEHRVILSLSSEFCQQLDDKAVGRKKAKEKIRSTPKSPNMNTFLQMMKDLAKIDEVWEG